MSYNIALDKSSHITHLNEKSPGAGEHFMLLRVDGGSLKDNK
jgi:hypothetical protein